MLLASFALLLVGMAVPAAATERTEVFRTGPITVGGYQVLQEEAEGGLPKPAVDGFVTHMKVDVVDRDGTPVSIRRLMLHHIVFSNVGAKLGEKHDRTCDSITALDSQTAFPNVAERFYAAGEERSELDLPSGYGYRSKRSDQWVMTYMLMNHRSEVDTAYIQYTVTFDDSPSLRPADPYWLDVRNCRADPVYDVPGGAAPGSLDTQTTAWKPPVGGRIVAGAGHVHGGGKELRLSQPGCDDRTLARLKPKWGLRSHPFYNVKPVLHEPGPVGMSRFTTATGIPIAAGDEVRLSSIYDAERPHTRVMGISILYFAPDPSVTARCAPLPGDVRESITDAPGRAAPPRVIVPLTGLDEKGRAQTISRPPGKVVRVDGDVARIGVRDLSFSRPNLSVARGATVQWRFTGPSLHDVTLASGPRGFSSAHLDDGRTYRRELTTPGTYKLFCSLHPVAMTQRIVVR